MNKSKLGPLSRREFGMLSAAALATPLLGCGSTESQATRSTPGPQVIKRPAGGPQQGLNIVFIFGDQERYLSKLPAGLSLPGHERLQRTGVTFESHYTSAIMCTPSRSVLTTGLQNPDNRMFDNADVAWVKNMSTDIPTIGHMLRKAGYYAAYKGKWHLNKDFDTQERGPALSQKEMDVYGFSDLRGHRAI